MSVRPLLRIQIDHNLNSTDVIDVLTDLFMLHGVAENIRSGNDPNSIAKAVHEWISAVGARTALSNLAAHVRTATVKASTSGLRE